MHIKLLWCDQCVGELPASVVVVTIAETSLKVERTDFSFWLLPAVAGDVVDPERVAHVLLPFVLVLAQPRENMDFVELWVDGGSLGETSHWNCKTVKNNIL